MTQGSRRKVRVLSRKSVLLAAGVPLAALLHLAPAEPVPPAETADAVRFYVAVAPLGDATGTGREDLEALARRLLEEPRCVRRWKA